MQLSDIPLKILELLYECYSVEEKTYVSLTRVAGELNLSYEVVQEYILLLTYQGVVEVSQSVVNNRLYKLARITFQGINFLLQPVTLSSKTTSFNKAMSNPQSSISSQIGSPKTILILASSPLNEARIRLDKEVREIDLGLRIANKGDNFLLKQRWAVRPDDLRRALLDLEPEIVHFCGHGSGEAGLMLEDDTGSAFLASTDALAKLFKLFSNHTQCVILNACYSEVQAEAICQHIDYVIGMNDKINDEAAIKFSVGFYDALVRGWSVEQAYELGCNTIEFANLPGSLTPTLKKKRGMISII